ncbi:hypothetical protein FOXG_19286 [Fusarium oxysporum f. sp. lycopersici 4287]|uniref:Prion-inhibition and propagation HeLo domain-containing protein n=2 Tax=Fusarium oxysporum f. sp. lycopersici (strain 4287 / CBS 123668 / FGSC 9935 / NRRL 34936) TaxID=426428 RepID=A0A0J9WLU8_FUSO4|nr:hypothetical protein FOXG_19286 [Fusarium oxysporum f. sp. lycopersici 4287]KNB04407.1 hypothetical protein FOXG_19286 [Fusarium oxysporum f. sp. lycopersici 4287]
MGRSISTNGKKYHSRLTYVHLSRPLAVQPEYKYSPIMEVAGLALGTISLFPIVLELFRTVTSLSGFAETSVILFLQLDLEREVLSRWGREVGLCRENNGSGSNCLIPSDLLPVVHEIIAAIGYLLAEATSVDDRPPRTGGNASTLDEALRILRSKIEQQRTIGIPLRQAYRRLRWAIFKEAQLRELIDDIHKYNNGLHNLVPKPVQARLDGLLLQAILSNRDRAGLEEIREASRGLRGDLSAAADVILLRESPEIVPHPSTADLMLSRSGFPFINKDMSRCLTTYRRKIGREVKELHVMVEWRGYKCESNTERKQRFLATCLDLARLLHASQNLAAYRTMDCLGILDDVEFMPNHRIGLVYRAPVNMAATASRSPGSASVQVRTLQDLINDQETQYPDLGQRFELAQSLSVALHRILVSRWFHKNMNSRNVLFFKENGTISVVNPFLSGFDYARPNSPEQETIKPDQDEFSDRYRHPRYTDPATRQEIRYSQSFDIYSLGVLLVEIGYWETVESIQKRKLRHGKKHATTSPLRDLQRHLSTKCIDSLVFRMGKVYANATKFCLSRGDSSTECEEEHLLKLFNSDVVSELAKCNA